MWYGQDEICKAKFLQKEEQEEKKEGPKTIKHGENMKSLKLYRQESSKYLEATVTPNQKGTNKTLDKVTSRKKGSATQREKEINPLPSSPSKAEKRKREGGRKVKLQPINQYRKKNIQMMSETKQTDYVTESSLLDKTEDDHDLESNEDNYEGDEKPCLQLNAPLSPTSLVEEGNRDDKYLNKGQRKLKSGSIATRTTRSKLKNSVIAEKKTKVGIKCSKARDKKTSRQEVLAKKTSRLSKLTWTECPTCGKRYRSKYSKLLHMYQEHGAERPPKGFICVQCGSSFLCRSSYRRHRYIHHNEGVETRCPYCKRFFKDKSNLDRHVNVVHSKTKEMFCSICNHVSKNRVSYRSHILRAHGTKMLGCPLCGERLRRPEVVEHLKTVHNLIKDAHLNWKSVYDQCQENVLDSEKEEEEEEKAEEKEAVNKVVGDNSADIKDSYQEVADVQPSQEKKASDKTRVHLMTDVNTASDAKLEKTCMICHRYFYNIYSKLQHMHTEHGAEPPPKEVICEICGAAFGTEVSLKVHNFICHQDGNQVLCPECGKLLKNKKVLRGHISRVHDQRVVQCEICGSSVKGSYLSEHKVKVHGTPKYKYCPWEHCKRPFKHTSHLNVHMRLHRDEKPITCSFCDYSCRQTSSLNWHMKKYHPNEKAAQNSNSNVQE